MQCMKTLCRKPRLRCGCYRTGCFQKKFWICCCKICCKRRLAKALSWPHAFDGLLAPAPPAIWSQPPGQFKFGPICKEVTFPQALALVFEQNYLCEPAWPSASYWNDVTMVRLFSTYWHGYLPRIGPGCNTQWSVDWSQTVTTTVRTAMSGSSAEQPVQHQAAASSDEQPAFLYYVQLRVHNRRMG